MEHTRVTKEHQAESRDTNHGTRVVPAQRWQLPDVEASPRKLPKYFRREWARQRSPGMFIAAMSVNREVEWAWVAARGRPRALTVGRHDQCDVFLPTDAEVSLRHLVCVVRGTEDGVSSHAFDLSTSNATRTLDGKMLRAWRVTQPTVVVIPGHHVFFLPTGPEASSSFDASCPSPRLGRVLQNHEFVFEGVNAVVSGEHLARGALIGRDDRCLPTPLSTGDRMVSRVHALVVELGGEPVIADTGSTNGLRVNGAVTDACVLVPGDVVQVGQGRFTWDACDAPSSSRYANVLPPGSDEQLTQIAALEGDARRQAAAVFADWLLEHGSPWGEWINAELASRAETAEVLCDELRGHILGPLAGLDVQFEDGIAIAATVPRGLAPLPMAHRSPHWRTLRRLVVPRALMNEWALTSPVVPSGRKLRFVEVD
ncbi:MAG: FHA domain-containing protein [Myxococcales bacterium]|nr:FHA domain-containing protein [Myxococcales bacterium]